MNTEQKTNLELANLALLDMKPRVTPSDRKEAPVNEGTVVQYLNGLGRNLDTAMKLLKYFKGREEDRRKEILSIVSAKVAS
jgi:hypothetical protein